MDLVSLCFYLEFQTKKSPQFFAGQLKFQVDRRKSFSKRKFQETCQREKITIYLYKIVNKKSINSIVVS